MSFRLIARFYLLLLLGLALPVALTHAKEIIDQLDGKTEAAMIADGYRSVVKVESSSQIPDYETPWNAGKFSGGRGTGFLIGDNQFLTNAHVVSNSKRVYLSKHGDPRKFRANVKFIAHDCDLALLEVEDFSPFENLPKFKLGGVPQLESEVRAIGYPIGGDRLSVTRGIVSRIDFRPYAHSVIDSHLVIQIDAAINPGNSGGPVIQDDKVIGVAFQGISNAENTGYVIPTPVIERFLKDIQTGSYDRYVDLGISEFPILNPAMRQALNLDDEQDGVLVADVTPGSSSENHVLPGDVLLSIDDIPIDNAGQILVDGERLNMNEVVERKFNGDLVKLKLLRNGEILDKEFPLRPIDSMQILSIRYGKKPRFTMAAGLTFQPLTRNLYAAQRFTDFHLRKLFAEYISDGGFREREDIVVLTRIEPDAATTHLAGFAGRVVDRIGDVKITKLEQVHEILNTPPDEMPEFLEIHFIGLDRPLIFPSKDIPEATRRIQLNYQIPTTSNLIE